MILVALRKLLSSNYEGKSSSGRRLEAWTTGKVVERPRWQKEGTEAPQDSVSRRSRSELKPWMSLSLRVFLSESRGRTRRAEEQLLWGW